MRHTIWILALVLSLGLGGQTLLRSDEGGTFFNGKNFDGWEGLIEKHWSIKDGALVGTTAPNGAKYNTFLCSKKKYGDFELKFQVKLNKTGNSGVQIRSHIHDPKVFAVTGPQCDMGGIFWGCLYGEHFGGMMKAAPKGVVQKVLKEGEFNDYYIKAVGKHITIKLNGETTVDADFPKAPDTGIIAWQCHGGPAMDVIFRNIQFTDLTGKSKKCLPDVQVLKLCFFLEHQRCDIVKPRATPWEARSYYSKSPNGAS